MFFSQGIKMGQINQRFTLNKKLILYTVTILMIATVITGTVGFFLSKSALEKKGGEILKNAVLTAMVIIEEKQDDVSRGFLREEEAKAYVKDVLLGPKQPSGLRPVGSPINMGENGYFIIYKPSGVLELHPYLEGQDVLNYQNPINPEQFFIQESIEKALNGGGFTKYHWQYPTIETIGEKVMYSVYDPYWGWIVSATTYTSDFYSDAVMILIVTFVVVISVLIIGFFVSNRYLSNMIKPLLQLEESMARSKEGDLNFVEVSTRKDEIGEVIRGYNQMIMSIQQATTDLLAKDKKLHHYAFFDNLTTLPNKLSMQEYANERIQRPRTERMFFLMDIKDFKMINSVYGMEYGDRVMDHVGSILKSFQSPYIFFARMAGNEFAAWVENYDVVEIKNLIEEFKNVINKKLSTESNLHHLEFHFSLAGDISKVNSFDEIYKQASVALQFAKENSDTQLVIFEESMFHRLERLSQMRDSLEKAIDNKEFTVFYQEKVHGITKSVVGVEALARWENNGLGFVSPVEFIPMLNKGTLIHPFTHYIIEEVFKDFKDLQLKYHKHIQISINLSPNVFFEKGFADRLIEKSKSLKVPPNQVILEITEDVFIGDMPSVLKIIHHLRSEGFKISLDDFGTGYSSLNYLASMPLDEIKIDKKFVDFIHLDEKSRLMLKTIVNLAKELDYLIVAEGVENQAQVDILLEHGCNVIQGYYYSKPQALKKSERL